MDSLTQQLLVNRLSWEIKGEDWRETDLDECVMKAHIKPRSPSEAHARAEKIVDAFSAEKPTN